MIQHWPRWIFASMSKYAYDNRGGLYMYIEGQHRDTRELKDFCEFRLDGPNLTELSKGYWRAFVECNILLQSTLDDKNFHRIYVNCGIIVAMMSKNIPIYKYGSESVDDESLLGCMHLVQDARGKERIQVSHFGIIDPSEDLQQSCVEAHYEMFLDT